MFGQNFDSSNLSAMSESLYKTEAFTDAEREDFFNAIHNVQVNTTNAYNTLLDIAVAADDPEMIGTVGKFVDDSYKQQGYAHAAYADQLPNQAAAMQAGMQEYVSKEVCSQPKELTLADLDTELCLDPDVEIEIAQPIVEDANEAVTFDSLLDTLVPDMGNCNTIGGEIIRAVNKLEYRFLNDGDMIDIDYGIETCNAPARFLQSEGGPEIKKLIDEHWGISDEDAYSQFITDLKDTAVKFITENNLDKVPNYKNLDYLEFGLSTDTFTGEDDYEEEALDDRGLHTPFRAATEDDTDVDMGSDTVVDDGGDSSDIPMDSGDDISESEEGIDDMIDDTEIHEVMPVEGDVVSDNANPIFQGKILNVHDDNTIDVKWNDDTVTRNTSIEDVTIIKPAEEAYKVYYVKENQLIKVIECPDPVRALAVYNGIKCKMPTVECFYVKSGKADEELQAKYAGTKITEDETQEPSILDLLAEELSSLYSAEVIGDGSLLIADGIGNSCIINISDTQPFELSLQVETADGDTSEVINYLYDGVAPAADFIVAAFSGEIAAKSMGESKKTRRNEGLELDTDKVAKLKSDIDANHPDATAEQKAMLFQAKYFIDNGIKPSAAQIKEIFESGGELDPELVYKIKTRLLTKHPEASLQQLQAAFATSYFIHTGVKPDEKQLEKVFESKQDECGTVADLGVAPILPASSGVGLTKATVIKFDDEETKRLLDKLKATNESATKDEIIATLKEMQASTGQDLISIIDFLPEENFKAVADVFGTTDSEEIANEIEANESKNESANFMHFVADAINKADAKYDAQVANDNSGMHISTDVEATYADAYYDPDSRKLVVDYNYDNLDPAYKHVMIDMQEPKQIADLVIAHFDPKKPANESMNPLGFVPDAPVTALDDKAQFSPEQAKELSKLDPINNDIQQKLTYRNQEIPPLTEPVGEVAKEGEPEIIAQDKIGFIPLESVESDLNQEAFTAAVVAVTDAVKLTDNVDAFTKLQELYPNAESKLLARGIKEAKATGNNGKLINYLYQSATRKVEAIEIVKSELTDIYGKDACDSVMDMLSDFDMAQAKDVSLFKEQAKLIIEPEDVRKVLDLLGINEDTFMEPQLNDAHAQGKTRADGKPIPTTNASGTDPVTPTLADDIDPAQVVVDGIPADQSEIDAVTGKEPENPNKEPDFNITQQV